ncbi:MAG TPA: hypothetical protein VIO61_05655 [Anaerolineaceae bacterium]
MNTISTLHSSGIVRLRIGKPAVALCGFGRMLKPIFGAGHTFK